MPVTPEDYRDALGRELEDRQDELALYGAYYDGNHRLQFATSKFRETFGELFEAFADNWCGLVVDAAVERLDVLGFRFGEDTADDEAWSIWQANQMDLRARIAHTEAVKLKASYLSIGPPRLPGGEPVISVESPTQCITAHDPADRRRRLAGLKRWQDVNGDDWAEVYTPEQITTWRRPRYAQNLQVLGIVLPAAAQAGADWRTTRQVPNPVGAVQLIPLENNPGLLTGGVSDLKSAISLQDAANKFFTDMIVASEYVGFPQRVLTGVELPRDPLTNEVKQDAQLRSAMNRLWAFESENAKVFDLSKADMSGFVEGVDMAVQHIAAQTRTPPHYLLAKMVNLSGDALVAAETGLVSRCRSKHTDFSDPWEEALRIAFKWRAMAREGWVGAADDLERSEMDDAETIWADPEHKDPVTLSQSLTMKQAIGVPQEILWEEAGYTPQQIKRMRRLREEEMKHQQELAAAGGDPNAPPAQQVAISPNGNQLSVSGLPGPPPAPAPNGQPKTPAKA